MKKRCLVFLMSTFLLLGFSGSVLAVDDNGGAPGDNRIAGYDIKSADVAIYPDDPADVEEYVTICLEMEEGSSLPGLVIFEFDLDNVATTGGNNSMTSIFKACEPTPRTLIKPKEVGYDISWMLFLRKQSDDVSTAWCSDCKGPGGECVTRGTPCDTDCSTCNVAGEQPCEAGDPGGCYVLGNPPGAQCDGDCQEGGENCYDLSVDCTECNVPCGMGRIIGEWYVSAQAAGIAGGAPPDRGRIEMPLPKGTDSDDHDCYTFPWRRIVNNAYDYLEGNSQRFDLNAAKDPANIRWQVSAWVDPDFATTKNDFFYTTDFNCAEVSDVLPNAGKEATVATDFGCCHGDFEPDDDVDGTDAFKFKSSFGRRDCLGSCPPGG